MRIVTINLSVCIILLMTLITNAKQLENNTARSATIFKQRNCKPEQLLDTFMSVYNSVADDISRIETVSHESGNFSSFSKKFNVLIFLAKRIDNSLKQKRIGVIKNFYSFSRIVTRLKRHFSRLESHEDVVVLSFRLSSPLAFTAFDKDVAHFKLIDWIIRKQIDTLKLFSFPQLAYPFGTNRERLSFSALSFFETSHAFINDYSVETLLKLITERDDKAFSSGTAAYGGTTKHSCHNVCGQNHIFVREIRNEGLVVKVKGNQTLEQHGDELVPSTFFPKRIKAWYKAPSGKLYSCVAFSPERLHFSDTLTEYLEKQLNTIRLGFVSSRAALSQLNYDVDAVLTQISRIRTIISTFKTHPSDNAVRNDFSAAVSTLETMIAPLKQDK